MLVEGLELLHLQEMEKIRYKAKHINFRNFLFDQQEQLLADGILPSIHLYNKLCLEISETIASIYDNTKFCCSHL